MKALLKVSCELQRIFKGVRHLHNGRYVVTYLHLGSEPHLVLVRRDTRAYRRTTLKDNNTTSSILSVSMSIGYLGWTLFMMDSFLGLWILPYCAE